MKLINCAVTKSVKIKITESEGVGFADIWMGDDILTTYDLGENFIELELFYNHKQHKPFFKSFSELSKDELKDLVFDYVLRFGAG